MSAEPGRSPIRLMLVDDHPLMRHGMRARLEAVPGFDVVEEAGTAGEALAKAAACRPDVVLLDVGLKPISGIDLVPLLLEQRPQLLIVMFSMYDNPEYVQRSLHAGARGYVLKDVEAEELVTAIKTVVAGSTFLSPAIARRPFRNQASKPVLSMREGQILSALARGLSSREISAELGVSVRTIEAQRQSIKRKLALNGPSHLIQYAVRHALQLE